MDSDRERGTSPPVRREVLTALCHLWIVQLPVTGDRAPARHAELVETLWIVPVRPKKPTSSSAPAPGALETVSSFRTYRSYATQPISAVLHQPPPSQTLHLRENLPVIPVPSLALTLPFVFVLYRCSQSGPVLSCRSEPLPSNSSPGVSLAPTCPVQFRFGTNPFQTIVPVWTSRSSSSPVQFRFGTNPFQTPCSSVDLPVQFQSSPVPVWNKSVPDPSSSVDLPVQFQSSPVPVWNKSVPDPCSSVDLPVQFQSSPVPVWNKTVPDPDSGVDLPVQFLSSPVPVWERNIPGLPVQLRLGAARPGLHTVPV
ncbi:hypothetical protein SKAU_G00210070 [Synaphobranchus kaupii]|uniref:Uncharacterized protein n=1 Tax=Synaphobranchus kaupii TaxID=118154 RepID=A0A9Q1F8U6_SYNKA|nr:hypothetical protein SKAU_G00210070 [Synaphobranchus kaupii]